MKKYGLKAAEDFTPHMILSYCPRAVSARAIEPIGLVANEFCLIHSRLWLKEYVTVGRWPLQGCAVVSAPSADAAERGIELLKVIRGRSL